MLTQTLRDYERVSITNMGAIPINLIDTNQLTIERLCIIITECNDVLTYTMIYVIITM